MGATRREHSRQVVAPLTRSGLGSARRCGLADGRTVKVRTKAELGQMAGTSDHQGIVAFTSPYPYASERELLAAPGPLSAWMARKTAQLWGDLPCGGRAGAVGIVTARRGSPG